jgi:hypothetical protein
LGAFAFAASPPSYPLLTQFSSSAEQRRRFIRRPSSNSNSLKRSIQTAAAPSVEWLVTRGKNKEEEEEEEVHH